MACFVSARSGSLPYGSQGHRAMQPGLRVVVMVLDSLLECARVAFNEVFSPVHTCVQVDP